MKTNVFGLNTKAVVAVGTIIILLLTSYAGGRTITDTSDDIYGKILCSNNNVYAGTAAYLQDAIESMNNLSGTVTLSASMNISIATTIQLYDKVELDLNGAILWATADVDVVWMHPESHIYGGTIRVSGVAGYSHSSVNISALGQNHSFLASGGYKKRTAVYDMYLRSRSMQGYGVHMYVPNTANDHQIGGCLVSNVQTFGFNTSFYLQNRWKDAGGTGGWINGNQFSDLQGYGDWCFIRLNGMSDIGATTPSWTATDGNTFTNLNMQPTTGSDYGLCIEGYYNTFNGIMVWDGGSYDVAGVYFRNTSSQNSVIGANGLGSSKVLDYGSYNTIQRSAVTQLWNLNLTHMARYQASATGVKFYANTAVNPYTYFYGATGNFGWLRTKSTGEFEIGSDDKTVLVNDVLQLQARTTKPSPASAGQQYYNSTDGHMYSYLGGAWVALDAGSVSDDTAYGAGWNGVTVTTPSKNAVYDQFHLFDVLNGLVKSDGAGVFSAVADNSGGWNSARAVLTANSNAYNSTRSVVSSKGAAWNASASNLFTFGLLWNNTRSIVSSKGAGWNSTQAVVTAKSGTWNLTSTQLATWRSLWNSTRAVVLAKSATWNATSALVTSKSADWNTSATWTGTRVIKGDTDFKSGIYFNLSKKIYNSKGHIYNISAANLQTAINDLNNVSGLVQLPACDITLTTYIKVGTGCHLTGMGNCSVLRLGNSANKTVIRNYDQTNGNDNIKISNLRIEGNSKNQAVYYDAWYAYTCGIWLKNCDNVEIYSITTNDTRNQGFLADTCRFVDTHDCWFLNCGSSFIGSGLAHYAAEGVYYYNTTDSTIDNVIVDKAYSCGIVIEGYLSCPDRYKSQNITVTGCVVTSTGVCYYVEDARNVMFDACSASCDTDNSCYGANTAKGFYIKPGCKEITISTCHIRNTYRGIGSGADYSTIIGTTVNDTTSYGMELSGTNLIVTGNTIDKTGNTGIAASFTYSMISTNILKNIGSSGIVSSGNNNTIMGNTISACGQWDAGIVISSEENTTVVLNHIVGTGGSYPNLGIQSAYTDKRCFVLFNSIVSVGTPLYHLSARVNCTGYKDWNYYIGVI